VTGFKVEITSGANFACSDVSTPVTVTTNPPNLVCEVCVVIVGSPAAGTYCSAPGAGAALPQTNSLGNASNCGSTKYYVQLRCVPQGSCFPT
jgi:hypothetical protein